MVLYEQPKLFFNATAITDPLLIEREREKEAGAREKRNQGVTEHSELSRFYPSSQKTN